MGKIVGFRRTRQYHPLSGDTGTTRPYPVPAGSVQEEQLRLAMFHRANPGIAWMPADFGASGKRDVDGISGPRSKAARGSYLQHKFGRATLSQDPSIDPGPTMAMYKSALLADTPYASDPTLATAYFLAIMAGESGPLPPLPAVAPTSIPGQATIASTGAQVLTQAAQVISQLAQCPPGTKGDFPNCVPTTRVPSAQPSGTTVPSGRVPAGRTPSPAGGATSVPSPNIAGSVPKCPPGYKGTPPDCKSLLSIGGKGNGKTDTAAAPKKMSLMTAGLIGGGALLVMGLLIIGKRKR